LPALYQTFLPTSKPLATLLTITIGCYGIADCIFNGLFSVDTKQASWDFSTWLHNTGSGFGYTSFLLFPLFAFLLYRKMGKQKLSRHFLIMFIFSLLFAGVYGLARIISLEQLPFLNQLGFYQRVSFFFNYLPIAWISIVQIKSSVA
jgi:hypothetical protein